MPTLGCDPSEVAIPWKLMNEEGFEIVFATPNGDVAQADPRMLFGTDLGIWKSKLMARQDAVDAYAELEKNEAFNNPIKYHDALAKDFDGVFLPGGHDKLVKEYLESIILQQIIYHFFNQNKPVGAICHGVVLVARSIDMKTGKSVLYDYKTTALLKRQEKLGFWLTRFKLGDYYLTYPGLTVEKEVKSILKNKNNFIKGSFPINRDSLNDLSKGFFVKDRNYISARWPGDIYSLSLAYIKMVKDV